MVVILFIFIFIFISLNMAVKADEWRDNKRINDIRELQKKFNDSDY